MHVFKSFQKKVLDDLQKCSPKTKIRRRKTPFPFLVHKEYGTFILKISKKFQTWPANSCEASGYITCLVCCYNVTYSGIIHAQYFALINLSLKLQICAKAHFSLLLILLAAPPRPQELET